MERDRQARSEPVAPSSQTERPAFTHWLQSEFARQYDQTLNEALPEAWLALLDAAPKR